MALRKSNGSSESLVKPGSRLHTWLSLLVTGILISLATGCRTPNLNGARRAFYAGDFERSAEVFPDKTKRDNRVLLLMERGMLEQTRGNYDESARLWLQATALARELDYLSLSRSSASLVINDETLAFRGMPFERTLCHAFTAQSFMLTGDFESAAVEGRNIVARLEARDNFPDCAFSRYIAGFTFEAMRDIDAARVQYRHAAALAPEADIDPQTGRFTNSPSPAGISGELIYFIGIGRAESRGPAPARVELVSDGISLGQAVLLTDRAQLQAATAAAMALLQTTKAITRIAIKETIAYAVETQNEGLGELLRIILYALERPDTRHWDTLPRWLYVARVPVPDTMLEIEVHIAGMTGRGTLIVHQPKRTGRLYAGSVRAW